MTKLEFTDRLRRGLCGLSDKDIAASVDYYAEMLDDSVEAGMTEEEAVAALGDPEAVAREILLALSLPKVIKTKCKKKNPWRPWEIVLLVLGSPIWFPLLLSLAAVFLTVYIVLWAVMASLWAVVPSLAAMAVGCIIAGIVNASAGYPTSMLLYFGTALVAAGLSVFAFLGCRKLTVLFAKITARFGQWVKSLFVRRHPRKEKTT